MPREFSRKEELLYFVIYNLGGGGKKVFFGKKERKLWKTLMELIDTVDSATKS